MLGKNVIYSIVTTTCINRNQTLVHQDTYCKHPRYVLNQSSSLEKVAAKQLNLQIKRSNTFNHYQSTGRNFQPETTFLQIHNNIRTSMDACKVITLTLLDLSSAFDTLDHTILLRTLDGWFGVIRMALNWFNSYLSGRCHRSNLGDCLFSKADLSLGVTPGSV